MSCRRRVILSGTPIQNDLGEYFAMVDFVNPGVLGAPASFRRVFEDPITAGRQPDASPDAKSLGASRAEEVT